MSAMARPPAHQDPRDAEIRRLQDALYASRRAIIQLMPEALRRPLEAARECDSRSDFDAWQAWAIECILDLADCRPGREMNSSADTVRAYCPLCGEGASSPYAKGFSMPTGLRRHLEGSHRSHRCDVFAAAADSCLEDLAERARPGYVGPNWLVSRTPPWKMEPEVPELPSATVIKFPGR